LGGVKFADAAPASPAPPENIRMAAKPAASLNPLDDDLAEGQRQISARNGAAAAASFERVLASRPEDERATYGLAVASALQGKPDQARELFTKVIAAGQNPLASADARPDSSNLSWSHIYLGRMYDVEGKRDLAVLEYRAALVVSGAPDSARTAAQHGIEAVYQTPSRDRQSDGKS
jgi:tetratricopeptide (TPR) repeat protein